MNDLIAQRYIKALLKDSDDNNSLELYNTLKEISTAYNDSKFLSIISSPEVNNDKKVQLILSFVKSNDVITNFVKLLAEKKRLDIIPNIANELKKEIAIMHKSYEGVIYTNVELTQTDLSEITKKFAKKFDVKLVLTQDVCDYDGIKVDIEGLGVEVGFSKDRLKSQMIEHILKAV